MGLPVFGLKVLVAPASGMVFQPCANDGVADTNHDFGIALAVFAFSRAAAAALWFVADESESPDFFILTGCQKNGQYLGYKKSE